MSKLMNDDYFFKKLMPQVLRDTCQNSKLFFFKNIKICLKCPFVFLFKNLHNFHVDVEFMLHFAKVFLKNVW